MIESISFFCGCLAGAAVWASIKGISVKPVFVVRHQLRLTPEDDREIRASIKRALAVKMGEPAVLVLQEGMTAERI